MGREGQIMKPRHRAIARLLPLTAVMLLTGGCVGFTEPPAGTPGEVLDLTQYAGYWTSSDFGDYSMQIRLAGDNRVEASYAMAPESEIPELEFTATLTTIGDRVIASIEWPEDYAYWAPDTAEGGPLWSVYTVEMSEDADAIRVLTLDTTAVGDALDSGALAGEIITPDDEYGEFMPPMVRTDGQTLREFLRDNPDAFTDDDFVLERTEPGAVERDVADYPYGDYSYPQPTQYWQDTGGPTPYDYSGDAWMATPTVAYVVPMARPTATPSPIPSIVDSAEPLSVQHLVTGIALALFVGVIAMIAISYLRSRELALASAPSITDAVTATDQDEGWAEAPTGTGLSLATVRHYAWPTILMLSVAIGPLLYLTILLRGLSVPSWVPGIHQGTLLVLHDVAPYLLVFSFGALIGVAEVANSYPAFSSEALRTKWAFMLVMFNALATLIVYSIVMAYSSSVDHPLLRTFVIAVGFAVLLRTRFVIARDLTSKADGEGISVNFGWLYSRVQQVCRQQIEQELMSQRRYGIHRLLDLYSDQESLHRIAVHSIQVCAPDRVGELRQILDDMGAEDVPDTVRRARMAQFVADTAGRKYVGFLVEHGPTEDVI